MKIIKDFFIIFLQNNNSLGKGHHADNHKN